MSLLCLHGSWTENITMTENITSPKPNPALDPNFNLNPNRNNNYNSPAYNPSRPSHNHSTIPITDPNSRV